MRRVEIFISKPKKEGLWIHSPEFGMALLAAREQEEGEEVRPALREVPFVHLSHSAPSAA